MNEKLGFLTVRAQGFHAGHRDLIRKAMLQCDKLIILIGAVNLPQTIDNPFTYFQRRDEIQRFIDHEYSVITRYGFELIPVNTYVYSDSQWISDVSELVTEYAKTNGYSEIIMFGHYKAGNDYLKWFPHFKNVNIEATHDVSGTLVREQSFKNARHIFEGDVLADYDYFEKERESFKNYPYPETLNFMCADSIVECAGQVLLVKRLRAPGRNNWALPGGFKNNNETSFQCAMRELVEETNLRVPEKVLLGSVVSTKLFDSPHRGAGIPRSTLAVHFKINLNPDGTLPRVSPLDDALEAKWIPIGDALNRMPMHDDHAGIISDMIGVMPIPAHKNPRYGNQK
jgi:bifunctional NMN adenylyltransferase/nudix hydrolase